MNDSCEKDRLFLFFNHTHAYIIILNRYFRNLYLDINLILPDFVRLLCSYKLKLLVGTGNYSLVIIVILIISLCY